MDYVPAVYTFSPYTYDTKTGQLFLRGRAIRLPTQTATVLNVLLRQPGQLISREELRKELWPGIDAVDSEQAINKLISQLRSTLRDDPRFPRYIETLPRRGYRFAAEVGYSEKPSQEEPTATKAGPVPTEAAPEILPPGELANDTETLRPDRVNGEVNGTNPAPSIGASVTLGSARSRFRRWNRASLWVLGLGVLVLLAGFAVWYALAVAHRPKTSAALLIDLPPMQTADDDSTMLAEAFRANLSNRLALLPGIKVKPVHSFSASPRSSGFMHSVAPQQAAGISLPGSLRCQGEFCTLDIEIVNEADKSHLASLHYQSTRQELPSLAAKLERDIVTRLDHGGSSSGDAGGLTRVRALEPYLEGRRLLQERTSPSLQGAIASFQQAVQANPDFSLSYSGMAAAYLLLADRENSPAKYAEAKRMASKALGLDDANAEVHAVLGCIAMSYGWKKGDAESELRKALDLDPSEATYHLWLASLLNGERRFSESLQQVAEAKQDDPFWPPVYQMEVMAQADAAAYLRQQAPAVVLNRVCVHSHAPNLISGSLWCDVGVKT